MAFGILEDRKLSNVPGTGPLLTKVDQATTDDAGDLKRGTGRYSHVVLLPQPSDDPRDPLNWPRWKKEACFWTLIFMTAIVITVPNLLDAAFVLLAKDFHVSVDEVVSSFGGFLIGTAVCALVQNPVAVKYGHRIVYLLSTFLMFISCVWTPLSRNLVSISASRVLQGVAVAPVQCLVPVTLEHMYFYMTDWLGSYSVALISIRSVHERGSRSSIWGFAQGSAVVLGIIINTFVTQKLSWKLGFWFASIPCGLCFLGVVFFVPETTYNRHSSPSHDPTMSKYENTLEDGSVMTRQPSGDGAPSPKPPTFLSQVKIYNGTFSDESIWKIFLRPFPFLLSPVTWFVFLSVSMPNVCYAFQSLCAATIYTIAYGFNAIDVSLISISVLLGAVFAMIVAGPLSDRWIIWMSKRNGGVYEPEYRLVFMLSMLFGVFGYVGWAIGYERHMPWIGAAGCGIMLTINIVVSTTAAVAYTIDTHGANSLHVTALSICARAFITYAMTFFANGLVLSAGVKLCLLGLGALQAAFWLSCIPMYVFGKRVRSFIARHPHFFRRDTLPASRSVDSTSTSGALPHGSVPSLPAAVARGLSSNCDCEKGPTSAGRSDGEGPGMVTSHGLGGYVGGLP